MNKTSLFDPKRFGHLIRNDLVFGYKVIGLTLLAVLVFTTIGALINIDERDYHAEIFPSIILIAGIILASVSFNELHRPSERHHYLILPASNLEKFASKLLISTIGFLLVITLVYWIYSLILNALFEGLWGYEFLAFYPLDEDGWMAIKAFIALQSVFLLGSVYFNHYAFLKTIGALLLFALGVGLVSYLLGFMIFGKYFDGLSFNPSRLGQEVVPSPRIDRFFEGPMTSIVEFLFWYGLPPFLWVVAYFKLKEREV